MKKRITCFIAARIPKETKLELDKIANERFLSSADIIREALRDYLANKETLKKDFAGKWCRSKPKDVVL